MIVNQSNDPISLKTYQIHYRSGARDFVNAHGYTYQPQSDEIQFFNEASEIIATIPQASGIRSVIDLNYLPEAPMIAELTERIGALEEKIKELLKKSSGLALAISSSCSLFL